MTNGKIVNELLEMSRRDDAPMKQMVRLTLSALAETMGKFNQLEETDEEHSDRIEKVEECISDIKEDINAIHKDIGTILTNVANLAIKFDTQLSSLTRNPLVWVGDQISHKPAVTVKAILVIIAIICLFIGVSSVTDLLVAISGIDPEIINAIKTVRP